MCMAKVFLGNSVTPSNHTIRWSDDDESGFRVRRAEFGRNPPAARDRFGNRASIYGATTARFAVFSLEKLGSLCARPPLHSPRANERALCLEPDTLSEPSYCSWVLACRVHGLPEASYRITLSSLLYSSRKLKTAPVLRTAAHLHLFLRQIWFPFLTTE